MDELISIIVPVYNVENYIDHCIETLIKQTYKKIEILIIDDGSTDSSGYICDEIKKQDNRIKVFHKQNGGLSDARNFGMERMMGKYILFVDSDDYLPCDAIEYLYQLLKKYNADISIGKVLMTSSLNENKFNETEKIEIFNNKEAIREMLYAKRYTTSPCGKLYRKELFEDIKFPVNKIFEDFHTIYKVLYKGNVIVSSMKTVYDYYQRNGSITNSKYSPKKLEALRALENIKKDIDINEYGIDKAYASKLIESIFSIISLDADKKTIQKENLWRQVKMYRKVVIMDNQATNRVRSYALLSYLGLNISRKVMQIYYGIK
jgi:glycosyltransferase involved in cell wall biosynthesis